MIGTTQIESRGQRYLLWRQEEGVDGGNVTMVRRRGLLRAVWRGRHVCSRRKRWKASHGRTQRLARTLRRDPNVCRSGGGGCAHEERGRGRGQRRLQNTVTAANERACPSIARSVRPPCFAHVSGIAQYVAAALRGPTAHASHSPSIPSCRLGAPYRGVPQPGIHRRTRPREMCKGCRCSSPPLPRALAPFAASSRG